MINRLWGGRAMIAAGLLTLIVFSIHPTHVDRDPVLGLWGINDITHSLALGTVALLAYGFWSLAEWLGIDRPLVRLAAVFNIMAVMLIVIAALVSGWVTPAAILEGGSFGQLSVTLNRACDRGYVAFTAIAMLLNGLCLPHNYSKLRLVSWPAALIPLGWVVSGYFNPDVHAMMVLAVLQGGWFVVTGWMMMRRNEVAG